MRYLILLSIVLICVAGCSESETESFNTPAIDVTPVNQLCPIMGSPVTKNGKTDEFDGTLVGFCCPSCIGKWNKLSDTDKAAKFASADTIKEAHGDHGDHDGHGDHGDHGDHGGHEHADDAKDVEKHDAEKDAASDK